MPRTTSIVYYFEALHKQLSEKSDFSLFKCLMINECFWKAGITIPGYVSQKRQIVGGLSKLQFSCREKHRYHFVRKKHTNSIWDNWKNFILTVVINFDLVNNKKSISVVLVSFAKQDWLPPRYLNLSMDTFHGCSSISSKVYSINLDK